MAGEASAGGATNADRALHEIKRAIIEGELPPGIVVSEHELAARLGMSRTPVHQALDRLRADGWVTIAPRSGVTVAGIDAERMRNIYEALMALEGAAALRFDTENSDAVQRLIDAEAECEAALAEDDLRGWANADNHFHRHLIVDSGNPELARLSASLMEHAHRARLMTVQLRPKPEASNADHREIIRCIRAGDHEGARAALQRHRERGMQILLPILEGMYPSRPAFLR